MKSNFLQQAVFVLAMLGHTSLSAQYIVAGCETETGLLTVGQETFTVAATGRFINSGSVYFTGVTTLTNNGGMSERAESPCVADYGNPCGNTPGASGANFFDNSVPLTLINGDQPLRMYAATIDRDIYLENEWQIVHALTFNSGTVSTDRADLTHFLHFRAGSTVSGNNAGSHVNGYAGWSGGGDFTLPVGDGVRQLPVGLTGDCSTLFTAAYFSGDPGLAFLPAGAPFNTYSKPAGFAVSPKEYWDINGATATQITLHFDADSDLDLIAGSLSQLVVMGWNGTAWVNLGQTGATGTLTTGGTVTCASVVPDDYLAYALGGEQRFPVLLSLRDPVTGLDFPNPQCGDEVQIGVYVDDRFDNLYSLQFSLNWDPAELEFVDTVSTTIIDYYNSPVVNIFPGLTDNGQLTYSFANLSSPSSLPDGTVLFVLRFRVLESNGNVDVEITGNPSFFEAVNGTDLSNNGITPVNTWSIPPVAGLVAEILTYNQPLCSAASGSATVTVTGGVGPYTYLWNDPASQTTETATGLSAGTYTVTVTSFSGCTAVAGVTLTGLSDESLAVLSTTTASCAGSDGALTFFVTGGAAPYDYAWDGPGSNDGVAFDQGGSYGVNNLPSGSYSVTVTDANGCEGIVAAVIATQLSPPVINSVVPTSFVHVGAYIYLRADQGASAGSGVWSATSGSGSVALDAVTYFPYLVVTGVTPGTATIHYTVTDVGGCIATATFEVSVLDPLQLYLSASPATIGCGDEFTATVYAGANFTDISGLDFSLNWDATRLQYLSSAVSNIGSAPPVVNLFSNPALTFNWAELETAEGIDLDAGTPLMTITFKALQGAGTETVLFSETPTPIYSNSSTFSIIPVSTSNLILTSSGGALAAEAAVATPISCPGGADGALSLTVSGGSGDYTFEWSNLAGTQNISGLSAGIYTVTVTDNDGGCTATATAAIVEPAPLSALTTIIQQPGCAGFTAGELAFSASGGTMPYDYAWDGPDMNDGTATDQGTFYTVSDLPAGAYGWTVTDANGCTVIDNITISGSDNENPTIACPAPDITVGTEIDQCGAVVNYSVAASDNCTFTLTQTEGLPSGDFFPVGTTVNSFTVIDQAGFTASCSFTITVKDMQPPTPICQDVTVSLDTNGEVVVNSSQLDGGSSDNCTVAMGVNMTGFANYFAPANWLFSSTGDGSVDASNAPTSVEITGNNNGISGNTKWCITAPATMTIVFSWEYQSQDWSAYYDPFGYSINGVLTQLTDNNGAAHQRGDQIVSLVSGESFCFVVNSTDGILGPGVTVASQILYNAQVFDCSTTGDNSVTLQIADAACNVSTCVSTVTVLGTLAAEAAVATPISCPGAADGALSLTVSGGSGDYTFEWSNLAGTQNISGLSAGVYTVTVTDNDGVCTATATAAIVEPAPLSVLTTIMRQPGCAGLTAGILAFSASGGTMPYEYAWDGPDLNDGTATDRGTFYTLFNLPAGAYGWTVTDANGCAASGNTLINGSDPTQCDVALTLELPAAPIACGDIVTYRVRAAGINGQLSDLTFSLNWDSEQLAYMGHTIDAALYAPGGETPDIALDGAGNALSFALSDLNPPFGMVFPGNEPLLEISFRVLQAGYLPVSISNDPFGYIAVDNNYDIVPVDVNDNLQAESISACEINLAVDAPAAANCGDLVEVAIRADGLYDQAGSMQFSVIWNTQHLEYVSTSFDAQDYGDVANHPVISPPIPIGPGVAAASLGYSWVAPTPDDRPVADGAALFRITYRVLVSGDLPIEITGTPTEIIAISKINFNSIPVITFGDAIAVNTQGVVGDASSAPTVCIFTPMNPVTHTAQDAFGIGDAAGLPAGVSASLASDLIILSGTPVESGIFLYNIPVMTACGVAYAMGTIRVFAAPDVSISGPAAICAGESATLTAIAAVPVDYVWSTGADAASIVVSPAQVTNYTVTVTSQEGCIGISTFQLSSSGSAPVFSFAGTEPGSPFNGHIVSPTTGAPQDLYRFRVKYADAEGDAPAPGFPKMLLNYQTGSAHPSDLMLPMFPLPGGNFFEGIVYEAVLTGGLPAGTDWNARFTATDASGCAVTSALPPAVSEPDVQALPDLSVSAADITFSNFNPAPGSTVTVSTRIQNQSNYPADNFVVRLRNEFTGADLGTQTLSLAPNSTETLVWTVVTPNSPSWNPIRVFADDTDLIVEVNENNNNAVRPLVVGNYPLSGSIEASASAGDIFLNTGCNYVTGLAVYQNLPPATGMNGSSVAGATVLLWLEGGTDTLTTYTNSLGYFSVPSAFCSPPLSVGEYTITGIVTDYTLIDTFRTTFKVYYIEPCQDPDLNVSISAPQACAFPGSLQNFTVTVYNSGIGAAAPTELKIMRTSGSDLFFSVPALSQGESWQTVLSETMPGALQTFSISAIADAENDLASECSYYTNTAIQSLQVASTLPNLGFTTNLAYSLQYPVSNVNYICQDNSFSIEVRNYSCVAAGASKMWVQITQIGGGQVWDTIRVVPPLTPGEAVTLYFRDLFPSESSVPGTYRLEAILDYDEEIAETYETGNIGAIGFVLDECYIDLSAGCGSPYDQIIYFDGTEQSLPFLVRAHNSGLARQETDFEVLVEILQGDNVVSSTTYIETDDLNPSESALQTVTLPGVDPCAAEYRLRVTVDTQDEVAERFETNNSCQNYALFRDYKPEGRCYGSNFWDGAYPTNEPIQVFASVLKRGDFRDEDLEVQIDVRKQGSGAWQPLGVATIGPLVAPGGSCPQYDVNAPQLISFPTPGMWEMRVIVDPGNDKCETKEDNNELIRSFQVVETPDFVARSEWINPEVLNPAPGQVISVDASFRNAGRSLITAEPLVVQLKLNQDVVKTIQLPPGFYPYQGFTTVTFPDIVMPLSYTNGSLPEGHVLRVIVDATDVFDETDELNNEATRLIVIGGAPDAQVPLLSYAAGMISATVKNFGSSPVVNGTLRLYYQNFLGQEFEIPGAQQIPIGSLVVTGQVTRLFPWTAPADAYLLIARVSGVAPTETNDQNNEQTLLLAPQSLVASVSSAAACGPNADGLATVATVSGGTPPYAFLWNNAATTQTLSGVPAGAYSVTIIDAAGQTLERQVLVGQLQGETYYPDSDGDGYGSSSDALYACTGAPAGYVIQGGDCDDGDPDVFPGATEVCNLKDDDCNGIMDDVPGSNGVTAPVVDCPPSTTVAINSDGGCDIMIPDFRDLLTPTDNCTATNDLIELQTPLPGAYSVSGHGAQVTVVYTVLDDAVPANLTSCTVILTAMDETAPIVTCPNDQVVTLEPGTCCTTVSWQTPVWTDNCQPTGGASDVQQDVSFTNHWTGYAINIDNKNLASGLTLTNVNVQASLAGNIAGNYLISVYMKLGTHVGFTDNAVAWTKVGEITAYIADLTLFNVPVNFTIPAGQTAGMYVVANNGAGTGVRMAGTLGNAPTEDANLRINQTPGNWVSGLFGGIALPDENPRPQIRITYTLGGASTQLMQVAGPSSGDNLCSENSPYTVRYEAADAGGNTADCAFTIEVHTQNAVGEASSEPTVCISTPLTPVTHATVGASGIGIATGLPAGVTASWVSGLITLSGTPTESGVFAYSIPLTGNCIENLSATGTITVHNVTGGEVGSDQTVCPDQELAAFTEITASEGDGELTFVWEMSINSGQDWMPVPDATEAVYGHGTLLASAQFRRVTTATIDNLVCKAYSNEISALLKPSCEINLVLDVENEQPGSPIRCGDLITYTVRATGLDASLSTLQFSVNWDTTKLDYQGFTYNPALYAPGGEMPIISHTSPDLSAQDGAIAFMWADLEPPFQVGLPDNAVLLQISFRAIGLGNLPVSITETPVEIVATGSDFYAVPVYVSEIPALENTSICDIDLSVDAPDAASCGDIVEVFIRADQFYGDVSDLQFSVTWDTLQLQYIEASYDPGVYANSADNPVLSHSASSDSGRDGAVSYLWGDLYFPYGRPFEDGVKLMRIVYRVLNSGSIPVRISNTPTDIIAADNINFEPIQVQVFHDEILVEDHVPPTIICPGDTTLMTDGNAFCRVIIPNYPALLNPTDNCTPAASLLESQDIPAGPYGVSGDGATLTLTYQVTDRSTPANTTTCVVNITVRDADAPVVNCPQPVTISTTANAPCQILVPDYTDLLSPTDNCTEAADLLETQQIPAGLLTVNGDGETFTLMYTVSDAAMPPNVTSCFVVITVQDTVAPVILLSGAPEVRICQDQTYTDAGASATDICAGDLSSGIVTSNPVNTSVPGAYLVRYNVTDAAGNAAVEVIRTVIVDAKPEIADAEIGLCSGLSNNLHIQLADLANDSPAASFSWSTPGNSSILGEPISGQTSVIGPVVVSNITHVTQTLVYTVTPVSTQGCTGDNFEVTVSVFPVPAGNIGLNGDLSLCSEEPRRLYGLVSGDQPPYTHTWTIVGEIGADGLMSPDSNFVDGPVVGDSIILKAIATDGGSVKLRHQVTDVNGCMSKMTEETFSILLNPLPNPLVAGDLTPCAGTTSGYTVTPRTGSTYQWSLSAGGMLQGAVDTQAVLVSWAADPGGPYMLNLRETNAVGCHTDNVFSISSLGGPLVALESQMNVACKSDATGAVTVSVTGGQSPYQYDWDGSPVGDGGPSISGLIAGIYTITVSDAAGCTGTLSVTITEPEALQIASLPADAVAAGNCLTISDVQNQFAAWISSVPLTTTGGVNPQTPVLSYTVTELVNNTSIVTTSATMTAPPKDGGSTAVTWTVSDACVTLTATRTFSVNPCMRVSGAIRYYRDSSGVSGVNVDMAGIGAVDDQSIASGAYSVYSATTGAYTVQPSKTLLTSMPTSSANLSNIHGINVADVQAIQAHVGSGTGFTNLYQRVAANVVLGTPSSQTNNRLTSADATSLSQAINGSVTQQARLKWRFIPSDLNLLAGAPSSLPRSWGLVPTALAGNLAPSQYGRYLERRDYPTLTGPFKNQHFTAVRVGDVVSTPAAIGTPDAELRYAGAPLIWRVRDMPLREGESLEVVFRAEQMTDLLGWQFGLHFDREYLEMENLAVSKALSLDPEVNFGLYQTDQGDIRSLWADAEKRSLSKGTEVFTLRFKAVRGGRMLSEVLGLDDDVLHCFALSENLDPVALLLEFEDTTQKNATPVLHQNTPNPFDRETRMRFELPAASDIRLSIHDVNGRLVREFTGYYSEGLHELRFNRGDLGQSSGVLYYTLQCGGFTATRRMVVID